MVEAELLSFAITCLKQSGLVFWRVPNQGVRHNGARKKSPIAGFPDLAGVLPTGKMFAIELKTEKGVLSPEQIEWITKLNHSGAIAVVLRTKQEIKDFIESAVKIRGQQRD